MRVITLLVVLSLASLVASECTLTCGANARCSDTGGVQACVCLEGFQQTDAGACTDCVAGWYKVFNSTTASFYCKKCSLSCGDHGMCQAVRDSNGAVTGENCKCQIGWVLGSDGKCSQCDTANGFRPDGAGHCVASNCSTSCNRGACSPLQTTQGNTTSTIFVCQCNPGIIDGPNGHCTVCDSTQGYVLSGDLCYKPSTCSPLCDATTQVCVQIKSGSVNAYTCACKNGYVGFPNCVPAQCTPQCVHGQCRAKYNVTSTGDGGATATVSYSCVCDPAYTGDDCNTVSSGQDPTNCGGQCVDREACMSVAYNGTNGVVTRYGCVCRNHWQNEVLSSGQLRRCTYCPPQFTGDDCDQVIRVNATDACGSVRCPEHSKCTVLTNTDNSTRTTCQCEYGYKWQENVCVKVDTKSPCDSVTCPDGSACVSSANVARCQCKQDGYVLINGTCSARGKCNPTCDDKSQVCLLQTSTTVGKDVTYTPQCVCKPHWVLDPAGSGHCVCAAGWTGERCTLAVDPCATKNCPDSTLCSIVDGGAVCGCPPDKAGVDCTVDLCANIKCGGGQCHKGVCVCPYGFAFNGTNCNVVEKKCETSDCVSLDPTVHRNVTIQRTDAGVTVTTQTTYNGVTDQIVAGLTTSTAGAQLSWNRQVTNGDKSTSSSIALTVAAVIEWHDTDSNAGFNPATDIVSTTALSSWKPVTTTDYINTKGDLVTQLNLETTDDIMHIHTYVAAKQVLVDGKAVPPSNNKFGFTINYPVDMYKYPDSKLCVKMVFVSSLTLTINDPGTDSIEFQWRDSTGALANKVLWDKMAQVGNVQTMASMSAGATTGTVPVYLCFSAQVPDVIEYDPVTDYSSSDPVTLTKSSTSTAGSFVPSMLFLVLSVLAFVF